MFKRLWRDNNGYGRLISGAISIVLMVILGVNVVLPVIHGANTSGWTSGETAIYGIMGIAFIANMLMFLMPQNA